MSIVSTTHRGPMRRGAQLLMVASGLAMVGASTVGLTTEAIPALVVALFLVPAALRFPAASVGAVVVTVAALALGDPSALGATVAGLAAAVYLVSVHAVTAPAGVVTIAPTAVAGACGFAVAAVLVSLAAPTVAWLPVVAPVAGFIVFVLAVLPLTGRS